MVYPVQAIQGDLWVRSWVIAGVACASRTKAAWRRLLRGGNVDWRCKVVQSADTGDDVVVTFYIKDADSQGSDFCETFYTTDRDTWVVQGKRRGPKVAAQLVALAPDETFCEMSGRTIELFVRRYVRDHYGIDLA